MSNGSAELSGNSNGVMSGFPWWVRATAFVGVPSLISMGLVLWLTMGLSRQHETMLNRQENFAEMSAERESTAKLHYAELATLRQTTDDIEHYLQIICVNTAKAAKSDAAGCFQ